MLLVLLTLNTPYQMYTNASVSHGNNLSNQTAVLDSKFAWFRFPLSTGMDVPAATTTRNLICRPSDRLAAA